MQTMTRPSLDALAPHFPHWEKTGDLIDQVLDLTLNLRQSGHPGGSRSKIPMMVTMTLGAGMRWDVRRPELAFGDKFVLIAGHCTPAVYAMLAVYNEALRLRYAETGDQRYLVPKAEQRQLVWEDLLTFGHVARHHPYELNVAVPLIAPRGNVPVGGDRRAAIDVP